MQLPDQALSLLNQNMLTVLSHGGLLEHAKSIYCHIRCQVAKATKSGEQDRKTGIFNFSDRSGQTVQTQIRIKYQNF